MTEDRWFEILSRIVPGEPDDLDRLLRLRDEPDPPPPELRGELAAVPPSARLWARDETRSYIGVRVTSVPEDAPRLALRLAAAAAERGVIPVILSSLPRTGFERYGFRVERLPEGPPAEVTRCEEELRRFWDMPIVIDAADVALLG